MSATTTEYIALLESVNEVHGTGLALASVLIALLAVVMTGVGIFAAYIMWRNSREQKEERTRIYKEYADREAKQTRLLIATYEEKIKDLIEQVEKIAQDAEGAGNGVTTTKEKLEDLISEYENKLKSLDPNSLGSIRFRNIEDTPFAKIKPNTNISEASITSSNLIEGMYDDKKCPNCGQISKVSKLNAILNNTCPVCGSEL